MSGKTSTDQRPGRPPSRSELRASLVWPVVIAVGIWLASLIIWIFLPGRFDVLVSGLIAAGLVIYLFWYQRSLKLSAGERVVMMVLAIPAILGLAFGMFEGEALYAITGVSLSLLLLGAQRVLTVPFSYRMARRSFNRGNHELALDLVDKSIAARPGFWEAYQLRALLYLSSMQFAPAERDALKALETRPDAHPVLNTLGQIYLVNKDYAKAVDVYGRAVSLSPKHALYHYHYGLALYRLGQAREAAEPLAAATRLGLPDVGYELQAYYYLGRALEQNGEIEKAEEVFADMVKFKDGVPMMKQDLKDQPDFPELPVLRADLRDIEKRLAAARQTQT